MYQFIETLEAYLKNFQEITADNSYLEASINELILVFLTLKRFNAI